VTAPAALRQQSQPTHQEPLTGVRAPEERDWSNWVSATRTRNFLLRDPLLDWLDVYGPEKGFVRDHQIDGYDPRTDFGRFIMAKGLTFERAVIELLRRRCEVVTIGQTPEDSRDLGKAQQTLAAMKDGLEVIHCGVLHDDETRTYGMPDLLVRADVLERLFPNAYAFEREAQRTGNRNATERPSPAHHYRVVDIKFTTLHLLKSGALNNQKSAPAYKLSCSSTTGHSATLRVTSRPRPSSSDGHGNSVRSAARDAWTGSRQCQRTRCSPTTNHSPRQSSARSTGFDVYGASGVRGPSCPAPTSTSSART